MEGVENLQPEKDGQKKDPKFRYQSKLEVYYQFEEN